MTRTVEKGKTEESKQAIAAANEARKKRKAERAKLEPIQKILNEKSPRCRQVAGMLLYQNKTTILEILETIDEIKDDLIAAK